MPKDSYLLVALKPEPCPLSRTTTHIQGPGSDLERTHFTGEEMEA